MTPSLEDYVVIQDGSVNVDKGRKSVPSWGWSATTTRDSGRSEVLTLGLIEDKKYLLSDTIRQYVVFCLILFRDILNFLLSQHKYQCSLGWYTVKCVARVITTVGLSGR